MMARVLIISCILTFLSIQNQVVSAQTQFVSWSANQTDGSFNGSTFNSTIVSSVTNVTRGGDFCAQNYFYPNLVPRQVYCDYYANAPGCSYNSNTSVTTVNPAVTPYIEFGFTVNGTQFINWDKVVIDGLYGSTRVKLDVRSSLDNYQTSLGYIQVLETPFTTNYYWGAVDISSLKSSYPIVSGEVKFRLYIYNNTFGNGMLYFKDDGNVSVPMGNNGSSTGTYSWNTYAQTNTKALSLWFSNSSTSAPTITTLSPKSGIPGSSVTITGTNFAANSVVYFGSVKAAVTSSSATSLTVTVPNSASNGKISVINPTTGLSVQTDFQFSTRWNGNESLTAGNLATRMVEVSKTIAPVAMNSGLYDWFYVLSNPIIQSGDFNLDGKVDIVVATGSGNTSAYGAKIYQNASTGNGNFDFAANPIQLSTSSSFESVAVQDFNSDGKLDIALGSVGSTSNGLVVYNNTSTVGGTISFATGLFVNASGVSMLKTTDINSDGKIDILYKTLSNDKIYVSVNKSTGGVISFASPVVLMTVANSAFEIGDVNNDKKIDLIVASPGARPKFYINNSGFANGASPSHTISSGVSYGSFSNGNDLIGNSKIVDINNDGNHDFVSGTSSSTAYAVNNFDGTTLSFGSFTNVSCDACGFRTHGTIDIDGDGDIDILGGANYSPLRYQININTSAGATVSFASYLQVFGSGTNILGNIVADLDNNGRPEYIQLTDPGTSSSQLRIYQNKNGEILGITTHPNTSNITYCKNAVVTPLTVVATGVNPTYSWYSNSSNSNTGGTLISGANSSSYTPSSAVVGTKYYYCVVTSGASSLTSNVSGAHVINDLTNISASSLASQPNLCLWGTASSLTVTAAGGGPYTYQWKNSTTSNGTFTNISGSTTNTYTPPTSVVGTQYYLCTVTGSCGTVNSAVSGAIVVNGAPQIVTQPSTTDQNFCINTAANVSVTATGIGLSYQWYGSTIYNGIYASITNATASTYNAQSSSPSTKYYKCIINGTCGSVTSNSSAGIIIVNAPTSITTHPSTTSQTVCLNSSFNAISASASGHNLNYQWQRALTSNGTYTNLSGANSQTYNPVSSASGTLYYRCVVTGTCGTSNSNASGARIVNPTSVSGTISGANSVCPGTTNVLNLTGQTGTIAWLASSTLNGTYAPVGASSASYTTPAVNSTVYYKAQVTSGVCPSSTTVAFEINTTPLGSISSISGPSTVTLGGTAVSYTHLTLPTKRIV